MQHGNTRFLSLLPALQRMLEMFEGLKSYFNSQEGCPTLIKKCFKEPTQELYSIFVHGQLKYFNETILKLEKENASAVNVASVLSELKLNLVEKKENNFIPSAALTLLSKLEEAGEVNVNLFYKEARDFYNKCLSYLDLYDGSYKDVIPHLWIDLNEEISWVRVCESAKKINTMYGKQVINSDSLFDEQVLVKKHMSERCKKEGWQNASLEQSGSRCSKNLKKTHTSFKLSNW